MTAQEKAKELVDKYDFVYIQNYTSMFEVKQCALIAVDELWESLKPHDDLKEINAFYWEQVKEEINKL